MESYLVADNTTKNKRIYITIDHLNAFIAPIEIFFYYLGRGMVDWLLLLFYCGAGCYWNHHTKTVKEHSW